MTVDLGQKKNQAKENQPILSIDKINEIETLNKLMRESNSRGKKQRIKKRIDMLNGVVPVVKESQAKTQN